jgi:trans-2,3-dihydro-3-hydroxyanthranilate isomerase
MKKAIYYLLDVFAEEKYCGNQLAIFPEASVIDENLLPQIARELNLSETVFLYPVKDNKKPMRIFTPGGELPTAGHPTIGTAFYMSRETDHAMDKPLKIIFEQKIGEIEATVEFKDNLPVYSSMLQPLPSFMDSYGQREQIAALFNRSEEELMDLPIEKVSCGLPYIIVPFKTIESVKGIEFRLDRWNELKKSFGDAFVYAFCPEGEDGGDVHGRMFAPDIGVPEDPATGSANGPLGCYCVKHKITNSSIVSEQGYEIGRRSKIYIDIKSTSEGDITAVKVGGKSVFIGKGEIFLN